MKRVLLICVIITMAGASLAGPVYAMNFSGPAKKLSRGAKNLVTFPAELPYRMKMESKNLGPGEGLIYGFFEGLGMMVVRAAAGAIEVATFFIQIPNNYKPILNDLESSFR